jgi:hypothetical protein
VTRLDWNKAKRAKRDSETESVRLPGERETRFLRGHQARLRREAASRRATTAATPEWSLLDQRKRVVDSVRAESADAARELFTARGMTGVWLRRVG